MERLKKQKKIIDNQEDLKSGYLIDYISGQPVKATPEEIQAVQIFAERLVEDYGYPKSHIQTQPQYRVRKRPSDEEKSYPIDIAVFSTSSKIEDDLYMIVECKKKNHNEGINQLKLYLDMSPAEVGVWFNGDEHVYLRKIHHKDGSRVYKLLPNIPCYGQRIEDIGLFKRKDLKKPSNLKAIFRDLRNHLAGMTTGITRDEALAQEIINILFCKILDEQETEPDQIVTFRAGEGEDHNIIRDRILKLFERVKTVIFEDIFNPTDTINLDAESLCYVVGEIQNYCIMEADRDAIGDAFEVFIGPALRGPEGQFFTPRNVVNMVIECLNPIPGEKIIDPACGSGGFLIGALEHIWAYIRAESKRKHWTERQLIKREVEVATDCIRGIDKDAFLAKVCKAYMALVGDGRGGVFCENSLNRPEDWSSVVRDNIKPGTFDVVITNPPFGNKIVVKGERLLRQFDFGCKWKRNKETKDFDKTTTLYEKQPPQLLFLERCLQLLKPGGRLGIVLPESILGNPSYEYVVAYLRNNVKILAVMTMPEPLFKTSGKGGTHTKVCILLLKKQKPKASYEIFMAEAKWCGHDSRGNPTMRKNKTGEIVLLDDVPIITEKYKHFVASKKISIDHLGFTLNSANIKNRILVPKYYNPEIDEELARLKSTHDLISIGKLIKEKIISIDTGVEIGKMAYGTGPIPFIRTSDLANWEIKADFKHGISYEIYKSFEESIDVEPGDILIVRDGTYLIGTTAIVTESDIPMLFQSHIYRIRVLNKEVVDPWLLFACLNVPIVKKQIRAKQFTQDIIDTIGKRLFEVVLPIPKDAKFQKSIAEETQHIIETRIKLRNRAKEIAFEVEGIKKPIEEDIEILENL